MKNIIKVIGIIAALSLLVSCGGGGGGGGGGGTAATTTSTSSLDSSYATVPTQTVAGRSATTSDGTTIAFNSNGTGGTISFGSAKIAIGSSDTMAAFDESFLGKSSSGSDSATPLFDESSPTTLTFTYDGDVITFPSNGLKLYMRGISGRYYLFPGQLYNSTGTGMFGKWLWKVGTAPNMNGFQFYEYFILSSPNIFQNPVLEANNYTGVTFEVRNGVLYLYDNGVLDDDEYCLYDGTYLYPIVWTFAF